MYITVSSIKRNYGFKGVELSDLIIGLPIILIFILLFSLLSNKIFAITFLLLGIFCMLPVTVSKKNRMYKVLFLMFKYMFRTKIFIYNEKIDEKGKVLSE